MIEDDLNQEQLRSMQNNNLYSMNQQEMMMQENERGMVKEQLDLTEELERIEHLLRGHALKFDKETNQTKWVEPDDNEMVILSDKGIHLVLNTINWYINKNTLLSNYDEETILTKMEDFATDLADTLYIESEKVFQYPTFEDCRKILEERIEYKAKLKMFDNELKHIKKPLEEIKQELWDEIGDRIEQEIQKIKSMVISNKFKRYIILTRTIQDAVHSTYNRAYKGMERKTLREHIHITENMGGNQNNQRQGSGLNPMNWFRKNK
jgi:hypothetical protein